MTKKRKNIDEIKNALSTGKRDFFTSNTTMGTMSIDFNNFGSATGAMNVVNTWNNNVSSSGNIIVTKQNYTPKEIITLFSSSASHRRKFKTKDTYPEQNLNNDLCHAVVTEGGKTVWMRGQCPQNLDDGINIKSNDPAEQTHKVMQNIKQLIEEAGGSMEHLVKIVIYITDINNREAIYNVIGEYTKGVYPVSTGLVVNRLARPEWLVEIDATAVIPL